MRGIACKIIGDAEVAFRVDDAKLTGMAKVGNDWPGLAPISDGKIEGTHIDFVVHGQLESTSG